MVESKSSEPKPTNQNIENNLNNEKHSKGDLVTKDKSRDGKKYPAAGIVKENRVNVRNQPSFKGKVIMVLHKNDQITILDDLMHPPTAADEPVKWYIIETTNGPSFIAADFVGLK